MVALYIDGVDCPLVAGRVTFPLFSTKKLRSIEAWRSGESMELEVLATYMDDELREAVNDMAFDTNQEYIELYIEQAREKDPQFIEILASEFGVEV